MDDTARRIAALREELAQRGAAAYLSLDPGNQTYLAGFRALIYSRPIVLIMGPDASTLVVPELEQAHAQRLAHVDDVRVYHERPGTAAPTSHAALLGELLDALPAGAPLAIDREQLPLAFAEELTRRGHPLVPFDGVLERLRAVKSADEIAAMRAAGELVEVGVSASIAACRVGVSELEIDATGAQAIHRRAAELGPDTTVELVVMTPSGPQRSTLPHVFSTARRLAPGDVLIHTRQVALNGYRAELERTLIVGEPSAEQARAFAAMHDAQQAAMRSLGPGVAMQAVDAAARDVIADAGFGDFAVHRTGHSIGIDAHERPSLRFDVAEQLVPGMVVTIEPGIYVPGLGGFRHSDTLVITETGSELVTEHPRALDALIVR